MGNHLFNPSGMLKFVILFSHEKWISSATMAQIEEAINDDAPVLVGMDAKGTSHWAVIYGYSSTHIYLADPSYDKKEISFTLKPISYVGKKIEATYILFIQTDLFESR